MSPGNQRCLEVFVSVSRCRISEIIIGWNDKKRYLETVEMKEFGEQVKGHGCLNSLNKLKIIYGEVAVYDDDDSDSVDHH